MKRPTKIRFETQAQMERIRRAAKLRKWSVSKFVVDAAEREAAKLLTTERKSSDPLMVERASPPLNQ